MQKKNRVLVIDDSAVARVMMTRGLNAHPGIEVVDAQPCQKLPELNIERLRIDTVVCDIDATKLCADELARVLAPVKRIPVVAVSSLDLTGVNIIGKSVVGFVQKSVSPTDSPAFLKKLASKIILAGSDDPLMVAVKGNSGGIPLLGFKPALDETVIALGASTGGTEATLEVLKALPADLPPLVIVQHMPAGFTKMYAERLNRTCEMTVIEASDATRVQRGYVYVAPAGFQTRILQHGTDLVISCVAGEKVSGHSPSVNVLYASLAELKVKHKVGIILTGMGRDGAQEMLTLRRRGGYTIGQDEKSSVVYGMPMEAYALGGVQIQGNLKKIPEILLNHLRRL